MSPLMHASERTECANANASIGSYFRNLISQHNPKLSDNIHGIRSASMYGVHVPIRHLCDNMLASATQLPCQRNPTVFSSTVLSSASFIRNYFIFSEVNSVSLRTRRGKELDWGWVGVEKGVSKRANYVLCIFDWSGALLVCVWIYEIARDIDIETHRSTHTFGRVENMDYLGGKIVDIAHTCINVSLIYTRDYFKSFRSIQWDL